jgi:hypothetical protein
MFERYTEQARRTLSFARYEAFQAASAFIETEHILLGLFRDDQSPAVRALARARVSLEAIRQEIESHTARRVSTPSAAADDLPFSEETESVLHYAEQEAERLLHREVRPIDIFILTATDGPSPGRRSHDDDDLGATVYTAFSTVALPEQFEQLPLEGPEWRNRLHSVGPILLTATTIDGLARWLEPVVGHQVIDETGLTGTYDIEVTGELQGLEELRQALREQLALVLTRAQREIEMLVVRRKPH